MKAPEYAHVGDSGADVFSNFRGLDLAQFLKDNPDIEENDVFLDSAGEMEGLDLLPWHSVRVPTGLILVLPKKVKMPVYYGEVSSLYPRGSKSYINFYPGLTVRPKSGRAYREKLIVTNTPGTIDNPYLGETMVLLTNLGLHPIHIAQDQKIAQVVPEFVPYLGPWQEDPSEMIEGTSRGSEGFGSTGLVS